MMRRLMVLLTLVGLLGVGAVFAQTAGYGVAWWVVAGGGGSASGGPYALEGTSGQPLTASSSGDVFAVQSGYWSPLETGGTLFLPFIRR